VPAREVQTVRSFTTGTPHRNYSGRLNRGGRDKYDEKRAWNKQIFTKKKLQKKKGYGIN
jgi:hypothetical protein